MTAEFESMAEILLVILSITCIVQVIFVGLLLWYVKRMAESLSGARTRASSPAPAAEALPVPPPIPPEKGVGEPAEAPAAPAVQVTPAVEILGDSPDIQASIHRLCEKYSLSDFIITTMDGLVVVSRFPGSSEEAARSSDLYRRKRRPDSPGVSFLEISHRGEPMLGIARSVHRLDPDRLKGIGEDARKILDWWL